VLQCALQCIVLQCAAVCPTYVGVVLQCVAVHVATCCSALQCMLQRVAVCCSACSVSHICRSRVKVRCSACCNVLQCVAVHIATCCNVLQYVAVHVATCCSVLKCVAVHVATCCSELQVPKAIATRQNFWCYVAVPVCVAVHCNTAATQRVVLQCVKFQCVAAHWLYTSEFFVADPDLQASYRVAKTQVMPYVYM